MRKDKLYLYYTQLGRCMYSGEPIDLADLYDDHKYDIDHIYPQSKTKDDSLQNRVLVKRVLNDNKSDTDPLPSSMRNAKTVALWKHLLDLNLISKEKYYRLMRTTPLSAEELAGFIARQLVETRQSSKATAQLLAQLHPDSEIVYSKAKNVSDFRTENGFVKSRSVNDYHHAKDAYLNIVVGNVYHLKFTKSPALFIKNGETYSLNRVFDYPVQRGGETAWLPDGSSLATVRNPMAKRNIRFTRYATELIGAVVGVRPGTGSRLVFKNANQLVLSEQQYAYFHRIDKWIEQNKKYKSVQPISYLRNLTKEDNIKIYDTLYHKLHDTLYHKRLSAQVAAFEKGREKFIALSLEEQCIFLSNALHLFQCNAALADLTLCGGVGHAGVLVLNNDITKLTDIKLIFQSVTGLFENELDLASL